MRKEFYAKKIAIIILIIICVFGLFYSTAMGVMNLITINNDYKIMRLDYGNNGELNLLNVQEAEISNLKTLIKTSTRNRKSDINLSLYNVTDKSIERYLTLYDTLNISKKDLLYMTD